MSACKFHIAIIEPSHIVYEGIVNILLNTGIHYHIYRLENIEEITNQNANEPYDIIIINPTLIANKTNEFIKTKQNFAKIYWIAITYAFFDKEIIELFNNTIQITDSPEAICQIIQKHAQIDLKNGKYSDKELLSEREIQVLEKLVHGLSNKEIADKLNISTHTVISHRKNITQKTGIKSQSGLTIYALSNKIISLEGF